MPPCRPACCETVAEFVGGNRITLLNSGGEYFPALLAAIDAASSEIYLETYIYADDDIGSAVSAALIRAGARGVSVRVLVDGFGGRNFPQNLLPRLAAGGVQAMLYRPELTRFNLSRHRLRRLHRKLVVIDAQLAFVGGINVVDDHNVPDGMGPRYDYAVQVAGPLLAPIHDAARRMWEIVAWANFKRRFRVHRSLVPTRLPSGEQTAAFLIRDNIRHRNDIANAYLGAIQEARQEIFIANAYFLPGFRFRHALRAAAARGVRIRILLQGVSDHPILHYATQTLYGALLDEGVRIFEHHSHFLHAKVAVVDGEWATVGSSNIDPFSLLLAKEANIVVRDRRFAMELGTSLDQAVATGAREIKRQDLQRMPLYSRLLRWVSYGLVRLMVGLAGYGPRHWQDHRDPGDRRQG